MDAKLVIPPYKYAAKHSKKTVLLTFTAALVGVVGIFLLSLTLWNFVRKMFVYTYFMEIKTDSTFFAMPAGLICVPSAILTFLLKSNRTSYFVTLIALQVVATSLLFTGYFTGMVYKLEFSNETLVLDTTIPTNALNATLYNLIASHQAKLTNTSAIDMIQYKFECCGINNKNDFSDTVPSSCFFRNKCKNPEVFPKGCLRSIQENVAWHQNITTSSMQIFILLYVFTIAMATTVFVSDFYKYRSVQ